MVSDAAKHNKNKIEAFLEICLLRNKVTKNIVRTVGMMETIFIEKTLSPKSIDHSFSIRKYNGG
jgi:hypothetical protein